MPAPRPFLNKTERPDPPQLDTRQPAHNNQFNQHPFHASQITNNYSVSQFPSQAPLGLVLDQENVRKRFRLEHGKQLLSLEPISVDLGSAPNLLLDRPTGLDYSLTRELVNCGDLSSLFHVTI